MNIHVYMYYNTGKVRKGIHVSYKTKHMNNCRHFYFVSTYFWITISFQATDSSESKSGTEIYKDSKWFYFKKDKHDIILCNIIWFIVKRPCKSTCDSVSRRSTEEWNYSFLSLNRYFKGGNKKKVHSSVSEILNYTC